MTPPGSPDAASWTSTTTRRSRWLVPTPGGGAMPTPLPAPGDAARYQIRSYQPADRVAVLALINADRLPGQPLATRQHLREALTGRSVIDGGWWEELTQLRTDVLLDRGQVQGVVSYAHQPRDAGVLLWLHAQEQRGPVTRLVGHVLDQLGGRATVNAFEFASALTRGVEALPVRHRHVTAAVLQQHGFRGQDLWRYMRRDLTDLSDLRDDPRGRHLLITTAPGADRSGSTLTAVRRPSTEVGQAVLGTPEAGVGVLWWLEVTDRHRGTGAGRTLINAALRHLQAAGAREAILYVDDDEPPGGARDRGPANRLYDSCGFVEVDRLTSFTVRAPLAAHGSIRLVTPAGR